MRRIVLLSGGMDSAVALAQALKDGECWAVSIQYGSVHQEAERLAARQLVEYFNVQHQEVGLPPYIFEGGESALMGEREIPKEEYHDITKETPSATIVPFRNANLISIATSLAESRGFDEVWVAMHATDHGGWAYPDCSPEFVGGMANAVYVGTLHKVRLVTPFLWMTKAQIVTRGVALDVPFELTWSCYRGGTVHCGECPTCLERIKAFIDAGWIDLVAYEKKVDWPSECGEIHV